MIKKVFNTKSETESLGIAKLLNMTDVKVALAMQKQNPDGFRKTTFAMGADNKNRSMIKDKDLMKMFKKEESNQYLKVSKNSQKIQLKRQ